MFSRKCGRLVASELRRTFSSSQRKTPFAGDSVLIPDEPVESKNAVPEFDSKLITHLERLSLVRFSDEEAVAHLREAVKRANRLLDIDVKEVEPMYTVWEDQDCPLHDDIPEEPLPVSKVLGNAAVTFEDYFVTPPGNIPLEESSKPLNLEMINSWDKLGVRSVPQPKKSKRKLDADEESS